MQICWAFKWSSVNCASLTRQNLTFLVDQSRHVPSSPIHCPSSCRLPSANKFIVHRGPAEEKFFGPIEEWIDVRDRIDFRIPSESPRIYSSPAKYGLIKIYADRPASPRAQGHPRNIRKSRHFTKNHETSFSLYGWESDSKGWKGIPKARPSWLFLSK